MIFIIYGIKISWSNSQEQKEGKQDRQVAYYKSMSDNKCSTNDGIRKTFTFPNLMIDSARMIAKY